jgi:hypothetical protein
LANADDNHNAAAGNHVPDTQPNAPDDDGAHDRAHAITHTYAIVGPHSGTYSTAHTHAYALANRIADFRADGRTHAVPKVRLRNASCWADQSFRIYRARVCFAV